MTPSTADITDEALVEAIADGDRASFEQLYDRHGGVVYGLARRMLHDPGLCEEVVQDVFMAVWQRAETFDASRSRALTFLVSITRNRCIDQLRRDGARPPRHGAALDDESTGVTLVDEREDADPAKVASDHDRAQRIRTALAELPQAQREAIELAYFRGMSQSQIAEQLNEPVGTIKTRMYHGMRQLRTLLKDSGVRDA